jgi:hypothetical protein
MPIHFFLYVTLTVSSVVLCGLAIWKGGAGERLAGIAVGVGMAASPAANLLLPPSLVPIVYLAGDGLIAMALLLATLRYASLWLGGVMLLYGAQFALHSFYFVMQREPDRFHAIFNNVILVAIMVLLTTGTVTAWRRRVKARTVGPAKPAS